jgi:hypothetical protein
MFFYYRGKSANSFNDLLIALEGFDTVFIIFTLLDYCFARGQYSIYIAVQVQNIQYRGRILGRNPKQKS